MADLIDKAEALEPCPFCGGEDVTTHMDAEQGSKWGFASCDACGAWGPEVRTGYDTAHDAPWHDEAIAAWNRRAIPARGVGVPTDCRKWDCYPIEMPLTKDGQGPAIPGRDEIASITYEVWDRTLETHASFDNLPDAINEAMRLSLAALAPTDAATQKGGDAHDRRLRSHEASPGVTAGADAAQAREAALMVALHDAVNAPKGVVPDSAVPFWNAAILRAMEVRDG